MNLNLAFPAKGIWKRNVYLTNKSAEKQFFKNHSAEEFAKFVFLEHNINELDDQTKKYILKQNTKPSVFCRYRAWKDPTIMSYSVDFNWKNKDTGEWASNGSCKRYGCVKFSSVTIDELKKGLVVSEMTSFKPVRMMFDLDCSPENILHSTRQGEELPKNAEEFVTYFKELLTEYCTVTLKLDEIEICEDVRSEMNTKWSWHISTNHFVTSLTDDMPHVVNALLLLDEQRKSWLQCGVLDACPYKRYNLWGSIYQSKWKDLQKNPENPRRFLPDPRFPNIARHFLHSYAERPVPIKIPRSFEALKTPQRTGKNRIVNSIRVSRKINDTLNDYNPGTKAFRDSRTMKGFEPISLFHCCYPIHISTLRNSCLSLDWFLIQNCLIK